MASPQASANQASHLGIYPEDLGFLTDLYQLTMTACYVGEAVAERRASFELFTRRLPGQYGYVIAAGLEQAIAYLENLSFSPEKITALQNTGIFDHAPAAFWELLAQAQFTGDLWAVPEGTAVFAQEPLLRVEAPLWQAQLVETYLLNVINYQTLIATRAARVRDVAGPKAMLLEFGTRRAFSPQGAVWAARAAIAGGLDATSNVLAALQLGQRPSGTMAHALVMALTTLEGSEDQAFQAFHRYFPGAALLIDTYDPVAAAIRLAEAQRQGSPIPAVRLDSGNLVELSKIVRSYLPQTQIFASGDLDEFAIAHLRAQQAPIDGYGLGTKLVTGVPVNGVYKLVEIDGVPVMKESASKMTYPGQKQIFRQVRRGLLVCDQLGLATEQTKQTTLAGNTQPLLQRVMQAGVRLQARESLGAIAARTAESVASLPPPCGTSTPLKPPL
ncbi:MAG: nicotinate phosphoribosyltransferase [Synechococcales cyanobacterium CRU_2_2]|nr:nicotinate phosphoribosyltransferase [Synechococcales cyanobacterium CRU_2_2]